ncbi:hypothetical protein QYM36_015449 [Artemia franciscana]|uniref:Endonuclease/exonuclease/phosphatase domain-containing protein n=1 Tax=Artemia franciscana TaxID=6661 RepID=A0AA88HET9_ARTSF|nr:hypothetical protein QYM36_015449 [Artemia franciscana]
MSKHTNKSTQKWTPTPPKILTARFLGMHGKLSVVVCYAPTKEATDEEKDEFYKSLQAIVKDIPRHDVVCFLGDFSTKVGNDQFFSPQVLGQPGLGQRTENRKLLIYFGLMNDLVVGQSLFPCRDVHKYSQASPDETTKTQIDHCPISRKLRSSLQDVRVYRGAEGSDHNLMITILCIKLKKICNKRTAASPVFDPEKL